MNKHIKLYKPILESKETSSASSDLITRLIDDAINSIFLKKDNSVILLGFIKPKEDPQDLALHDIDETHGYTETDEYIITLDCLYIGHPELDEELKSANLRRFTISLNLHTGFSYTSWSDLGDRDTPGDSGTEISDETTTLISIYFNNDEVDIPEVSEKMIDDLLSDYGYGEIIYDLEKNGKPFVS